MGSNPIHNSKVINNKDMRSRRRRKRNRNGTINSKRMRSRTK